MAARAVCGEDIGGIADSSNGGEDTVQAKGWSDFSHGDVVVRKSVLRGPGEFHDQISEARRFD